MMTPVPTNQVPAGTRPFGSRASAPIMMRNSAQQIRSSRWLKVIALGFSVFVARWLSLLILLSDSVGGAVYAVRARSSAW